MELCPSLASDPHCTIRDVNEKLDLARVVEKYKKAMHRMSKVHVQSCDGSVGMTGLTALRSLLAMVQTHTLRVEFKDKFGRVEEEAAWLEKKAHTSAVQFHIGKVMQAQPSVMSDLGPFRTIDGKP